MKLPDSAIEAAAQQLGDANDWPLYVKDAKAAILAFLEAAKASRDAREGVGCPSVWDENDWAIWTTKKPAFHDECFPVIILRVQG